MTDSQSKTANRKPKIVVLGLDGLTWPLLERLFAAGAMPHLARLRREGAWGPLASVVPTQSATAWASFITGQNPGRHGVVDFMVRQADGSYHHAKPNPATTLWRYLGRAGLRVGAFNFPVTYPPDPVHGFLVSGMLTPEGRTFTHPASLGDELLAAFPGYRLDLEWQLYDGRERAMLGELTEMTRLRAEVACYLRDRYAPDCLAVAFIGTDRLQHALWRHLDPDHPHHTPAQADALAGAIHGFYTTLDQAVGQLVAGVGDDTAVLVLSDHGFQPAAWQFRVDDWLAELGWLARQTGRSRVERWVRRLDTPQVRHLRRRLVKDISQHVRTFAPGGTVDWSRTVAFNPWNAQQGVRLNVRGRESHGAVAPGADYERLRDQIATALRQAVEPQTGRAVVDRVWKREDLYDGPFFDEMPDLVFALAPGFAESPLQPDLWAPTGWGSGDHSLTGMFIAWGRGIAPGQVQGAELIDVAPTALYLLDQPQPSTMDGKVLTAALDAALVAANPSRRDETAASPPEAAPGGDLLTAAEEAEIQERLRGLGYL
jgi:predicted AlkP superfamily phosphohydrolase/phosphomutase